ncbi:MAG TPA: M28 family peptidase [Bacteroidota bacterium]|nr:M28 family peptidase [Bacteroidota bacterium]
MRRIILCLLISIAATSPVPAQKTAFSQDSAYANLSVLVNTIGPRPMGSPAEARGLAFAAERFKAYGCQEAYVMPMTEAAGVNTTSGIAVGILKGRSSRIILIGGHMDSEGPEVPGANDDGSGAASVIELARVIGKTQHQSTVVFCCWGGEEEGLRGSQYFVEHFPQIDSVALMLQIDMADGAGDLEADPDAKYQISAPRWLVEASFDIFYNDLKYEGLVYPTQDATINSSSAQGTGSDHMSFLDRGIPAIDFTSDVGFPIHTPLDSWANFTPSGLQRSGDLVLKLFERFDGGVPSHETEKYWLVVLGHTPLFFSHLPLRVFAVLAFFVAAIGLVVLRRRRTGEDRHQPVRWSTLKLLLFTIIIQSFMWLSEDIIGIIKAYRYPWVNNWGGFVIFGILFGLLALWLVLRALKYLPLSRDAYVYYLRAFILITVGGGLLSWANAELGVYPAFSLLFLGLAVLVPPAPLKALFALLVPYPIIRLLFPENLTLYQRILSSIQGGGFGRSMSIDVSFIFMYVLFSLPFVYAFASIYRDSKRDLFWLKRFGSGTGLALTGAGIVIVGIILINRPVYDALWQPAVRVTQTYRLGADSGRVFMTSSEFLRGLKLNYDGRDTTLGDRFNFMELRTARPATVPWLALSSRDSLQSGASDTIAVFTRHLTLHSRFRPLMVTVDYRSRDPFTARSPWASGGRRGRNTDRLALYTWYSFPDTALDIPVTFAVKDSQKITEAVEVTYDSLSYPLTLERPLTYFLKRSVVEATDTLMAPRKDP